MTIKKHIKNTLSSLALICLIPFSSYANSGTASDLIEFDFNNRSDFGVEVKVKRGKSLGGKGTNI